MGEHTATHTVVSTVATDTDVATATATHTVVSTVATATSMATATHMAATVHTLATATAMATATHTADTDTDMDTHTTRCLILGNCYPLPHFEESILSFPIICNTISELTIQMENNDSNVRTL